MENNNNNNNILNVNEKNEKVDIKDCIAYKKDSIEQILYMLDDINVKGSTNCRIIATIYDILNRTSLKLNDKND